MSRKRTKAVPEVKDKQPDGSLIDLVLQIFTKLGVKLSDRPRPDILAGFVDGLLDELLWGEIWGGNEIHVQISSAVAFTDEQIDGAKEKMNMVNDLLECTVDGERWLRVTTTAPRAVGGGRHVTLVARIKPKDGKVVTSDFLEDRVSVIVAIIKNMWPLRSQ